MSHYSAWVSCSSALGYGILAVWMWITLLVGFIQLHWTLLILFPWWFFIISTFYVTTLAAGSHKERVFGSISKVFAPFMIFLYWASVYPNHDPWHSSTETYLVLAAHIFVPGFILLEIVRPKNTHYARFRQINADFLISNSFVLNTVVYVLYLVVYLIALPLDNDPIYKTLGFSMNEPEDAILAFAGWGIIMAINTVIAIFTWWCKEREVDSSKQNFLDTSSNANPLTNIYVMDK